MSKLALSLAGLMVMLCFLGKAQAAQPGSGGTPVTIFIDGKVVKQVTLNEGDNDILLCGCKVAVVFRNGIVRIDRISDSAGRALVQPALSTVGPRNPNCYQTPLGEVCFCTK